MYDQVSATTFTLALIVRQTLTYYYCPEIDGGTGLLSPTLSICEVFEKTAFADTMDCPP